MELDPLYADVVVQRWKVHGREGGAGGGVRDSLLQERRVRRAMARVAWMKSRSRRELHSCMP